MSKNWVMSLDNLAASGVIDYDAPAFLLGQPQRYAGHPNLEQIPMQNPAFLPQNVKMNGNQPYDSFNKDGNLVHNPTWKKILFAGVAIGGTALIAASVLAGVGKLKGLTKIKLPKIKLPKFKMPKLSGVTTKIKSFGSKIGSFMKKPINRIKGIFHKP